jgi:hypothetical protein
MPLQTADAALAIRTALCCSPCMRSISSSSSFPSYLVRYPAPQDDRVADVPNVHAPGPPIPGLPHQAHDQAWMRQGEPHIGTLFFSLPSTACLHCTAPATNCSSSTGLCTHVWFFPPSPALPLAPAAAPQAPSIFPVRCAWDGCDEAVSATPSEMEMAARFHLMTRHGKDEGLSKKGNVEKSCRFDGCRCAKRHCMIAGPHSFHSSNLRTHVVRTHFGGPCKRAAKAG